MMKTAFLYSHDFARFDYGRGHPLKPYRLRLTYELMQATGLLETRDPRMIVPSPADRKDLLLFHSPDYLDVLEASNRGTLARGAEAYGLGPGDNPVFPGLFDWSRLIAGASLTAAEMVDRGEAAVAFNIAGGLHHAQKSRASGFCYVNDPALAIGLLVRRGRRVVYIDIDAHHGDGVQEAFYGSDRVLTISFHETGEMLFPGTGFSEETGIGEGRGFSVNLPLPPETDDELFFRAVHDTVPLLVERFRPDIMVTQLGVDTFRTDPLAHMNVTTNGFCKVVALLATLCPKWVALGGGGYDVANVARAWTLAWAIMNGNSLPQTVPAEFLQRHPGAGFVDGSMQDAPFVLTGSAKESMRSEVDHLTGHVRQAGVPIR